MLDKCNSSCFTKIGLKTKAINRFEFSNRKTTNTVKLHISENNLLANIVSGI